MKKEILIMNVIIIFYIIQRLSEVLLSKGNEQWLKEHHQASEISKDEILRMKLFHASWFISLIIESNLRQSLQAPLFSLALYSILAVCLIVRLHTMDKLKRFWTIKVLSLKSPTITTDGLYRFIRHPNYLIVIIELLVIPLLFKAYWTMIIFSILHLFIITKRIKNEEASLMGYPDYKKHFKDKKRLIPYIFILPFLCLSTYAMEINISSSSYEEAKTKDNFLKFESTSTKLGLITTSFDGYAKDFKVSYEKNKNVITQLDVTLRTQTFDTDNRSRNEKMQNDILEINKFPTLKATLTAPINLELGAQDVTMTFTVKDKTITRTVSLYFSEKDNLWIVYGKTQVSLKELGLPDPSIAIAKVRDAFDITFHIFLEK